MPDLEHIHGNSFDLLASRSGMGRHMTIERSTTGTNAAIDPKKEPFRLAWFGGIGEGGVPAMGKIFLAGLLNAGVAVDMYRADVPDPAVDDLLAQYPHFAVVTTPSRWSWDRWYSRRPIGAFITGTFARVREHIRLTRMLVAQHRNRPYDCVFQLSQTELFEMGQRLSELPPVVVHPCTHAQGELRWHRRESAFARQSESKFAHYAARVFLSYRARNQAAELRKPALVVGPSQRFLDHLVRDYGLEPKRTAVLRHPIILPESSTTPPPITRGIGPVRLLFASRMSVRKGLDHIIALSHRLDDLVGCVMIDVVGGKTLWSDYTRHLTKLNSRIATYHGTFGHRDMIAAYDSADAILVPSLYEPGSLVVGEALSRGAAVIASDEVGPTEVLGPPACLTFPHGDLDAFEQTVRGFITEVSNSGFDANATLRADARRQAMEHFAPEYVVKKLLAILHSAAGGGEHLT